MSAYAYDLQQQEHGLTVEIYDQPYHLRGEDAEYMEKLAGLVDSKMRAVASQGTTVDSLRVAVLAALNIADQYVALQAKHRALTGSVSEAESQIRTRAHNLTGLLDSILSEERRVS